MVSQQSIGIALNLRRECITDLCLSSKQNELMLVTVGSRKFVPYGAKDRSNRLAHEMSS